MQPGAKIIEGLSHEQYAELPGEHSGGLKHMLVSPWQYARMAELPDNGETDAMRLGRATHTAIFQPERLNEEYIAWDGDRRGNAWDEFSAEAALNCQTVLKNEQLDEAVKIARAVRRHKIVSGYLCVDGRAELVLTWIHDRTGIRLRARLDWLGSVLADLKTCRDPAPGRFSTTSAQFGYHIQLALYADAAAACGLGTPPVRIIAAQNHEPYDVVVYKLHEDALYVGRMEYERALDLLVACRESGQWPGLAPDEELPLVLPAWTVPDMGKLEDVA